MADRDKWSDADVDDWFAESEDPGRRRARIPDSEARTEEKVLPSDADDWLAGAASPRARRPSAAAYDMRKVLVVGGIGVVLLLIILALAGVFSSSSPKRKTASTPSTPTRPTTTAPAPVQAPTSTLKPGDHSAQVRLLQRALTRLGYSTGGIDGVYGAGTKTAVSKFQQAQHLTPDGVVGPATLSALTRALRASG